MTLEEAMEFVGEYESLKMDGYDDCIIGVAYRCSKQPLLVYDREKIVEKLMRENGSSYEEAWEYCEFNMEGAWMGEGTPLFMIHVEEE